MTEGQKKIMYVLYIQDAKGNDSLLCGSPSVGRHFKSVTDNKFNSKDVLTYTEEKAHKEKINSYPYASVKIYEGRN